MALPNPSFGVNRMRGLFTKFMYGQCSRFYSKTKNSSVAIRVIRPTPPPPPTGLENATPGQLLVFALVGGAAGSSILYLLAKPEKRSALFPFVTPTSSLSTSGSEVTEKRKLTPREKRFIKFASVEYDGQIYMTPQDFLESVVEGEPRPRFKRKKLNKEEVKEMLQEMPKLQRNSQTFFRGLGNRGVISFSEYLFLLTILIKPQSGLKIAFAMLDQDGNQNIDKTEFKVLETVFSSAAKERKQQQLEESNNGSSVEKADEADEGSNIKEVIKEAKAAARFDDLEHGLHRIHSHKVDTSLLIYFFGQRGDRQLGFDDFRKFMDNLQTEVLAMEYNEFAKGAPSITEIDFARILLRYTFLHAEEYELILERLIQRIAADPNSAERSLLGISFEEFKDFCLFLNNLDDFQIAMRMYTLADKAISQEEFSRAVTVCTGRHLSKHLVRTVFQIFDNDGDGLLSYQEFVAMMKDRVNRGLKSYSRQEGWTGFKRCVKQEVTAASSK